MNTERQKIFMNSFLITVLEALKAVSESAALLSELTEVNNWP